MFKKLLSATVFSIIFPLSAFAQEAAQNVHKDHQANYWAEHWYEIPLIIIFIVAVIFAFRVAFWYGGIIGKALNLVSVGILILEVSDIISNIFLHFFVGAEETLLHYIIESLQFVGAGVITFAFWRLHVQTKQQFLVQEKK